MQAQAVSRAAPTSLSDRRIRRVGLALSIAAVGYALAAVIACPHGATLSGSATIFSAAVVPGLVVVALLWAAQPHAYPRSRRAALVGLIIFAAALVAITPLVVAGFWP